jgi:hypothetical protein
LIPDEVIRAPLKKLALMFSQIATVGGEYHLEESSKSLSAQIVAELRWLYEQGILLDPRSTVRPIKLPAQSGEVLQEWVAEHARQFNKGHVEVVKRYELNPKLSKDSPEIEELVRDFRRTKDVRILRGLYHIDAYPVFLLRPRFDLSEKPVDVASFTLNEIPTPDESTPWEQIIEFRSDPDSYHKFVDLRDWMGEVSRSTLPPNEIEGKLEYLISQYERHMRLHTMKVSKGTLEAFFITGSKCWKA